VSSLRITTDQAVVGMIVANNIYSRDSQLLVGKDTILSERNIIRLKLYGIREIDIVNQQHSHRNLFDEIEYIPEQLSIEPAYYSKVRDTEEFKQFKESIEGSADYLKDYFNKIVTGEERINSNELIVEIESIISESRNGIHLLDMLNCMKVYDDSTYIHSINVALICYAIGRWINLPKEDVQILALAGLFHDIGKLLVPKDIVLKPTKLTEHEYVKMKDHVVLGYEILKNQKIDNRIKITALMHHEKCDKSGYPMNLSGEQIEPFAKIVAIADVYDAMTANRIYRGPICPFEVIAQLESDGLHQYDPNSLLIFLDRMVQSYINNWVVLSNKEIAEIIMINKSSLSKPVVRTKNEHYIDLSRERNIEIMAFI
jgi:putative nucleotidyltransferase with HDIG domain